MNKAWLFGLFFVFACFVSADCAVRNSCLPSENALFNVSNIFNAHVSVDGAYLYRLCCENFSFSPGSSNVMLKVNKTFNSHVEQSDSSNYFINYTIDQAVYYAVGGCNAGDECLITISGATNAHVADCNNPFAYSRKVCGPLGGTGFTTDMICGDVRIGGINSIDPACNVFLIAGSPPKKNCAAEDSCVYASETDGSNPECKAVNETLTNANGFDIYCSLNNTWCPLDTVFNDTTNYCEHPAVLCNYGYNDWGFEDPDALCLNIGTMLGNLGTCFYDFDGSHDQYSEYPYNESCCHEFTWTNQSELFSFYSPEDVIII